LVVYICTYIYIYIYIIILYYLYSYEYYGTKIYPLVIIHSHVLFLYIRDSYYDYKDFL